MATESGSGPTSGRATLLTVDQINSDHVTEVNFVRRSASSFKNTRTYFKMLFTDCFKILGTSNSWSTHGI